jgi:hypothetical protein
MSHPTRGPVFVAGLERTGTSLLYALLASHPSLAMTRRTNLWRYFYGQYGDLAQPENLGRCLDTMMRYKRLLKLAPDRARIETEFRQGEATYARLFELLERHHAERVGRPRWGDKSLHTERYAEPIFAAYPGARILHMMRDPRDRYASVQTRWERRLGGTGAGMAEWLSSARFASLHADRYPNQYKVIRYEDLAGRPEETMRAVCEFIDEPYDDALFLMDGAATFRDQGSNSSYGARPAATISTDSIGRYREVLSGAQIKFIETVAAGAMKRYGYTASGLRLSLAEQGRFAAAVLPVELARLTGSRARYEWRNRRGRSVPDYRLIPTEERV